MAEGPLNHCYTVKLSAYVGGALGVQVPPAVAAAWGPVRSGNHCSACGSGHNWEMVQRQ